MPTISRDGDKLVVESVPREHPALKLVPGVTYKGRRQRFDGRLSWVTYAQLYAIFGAELTVDPSLDEWLATEGARQAQLRWLGKQLELPPDWDFLGENNLYPPQRVGTEFLLLAKGAVIGDEMGGGKTPQICIGIKELLDAHPGRRALIVGSKSSLTEVWVPHVRKWTGIDPAVAIGNIKERRAAIESDSPIVMMSYDTLLQHTKLARFGNIAFKRCPECLRPDDPVPTVPVKAQQCEAHAKELNAIDWLVVAADEIHKCFDPKSKRTRALKALMWPTEWRWGATGTPSANHEADFWSILNAVQPNEFPSRSQYIERYVAQGWSPWGGLVLYGLKADTRDEFTAITDAIMIRRPRKILTPWLPDALPPEVRVVELPRALRTAYDEVKDDLIAQIDGGMILAPNPLTNTLRLRQLACAMLEQVGEDDEGKPKYRMIEPSPKIDELEAIIEEVGPDEPLVVFAESRQLIQLAEERLAKNGTTFSSFHGAQLDIENTSHMARWQRGETQVLLMTLAKGAESFTLVRSHIIIYIMESYSFLQMQQSRDRIDRDGQTKAPLHIHIRSANTVETKVAAAQSDKGERFEALVRDAEWLKELL